MTETGGWMYSSVAAYLQHEALGLPVASFIHESAAAIAKEVCGQLISQ